MSRTSIAGRRWVAAVAAASLVVAGGIALTPSAFGAPGSEEGASKGLAPRAYQYGNWVQPGAGLTVDSSDTMSQVYQLISRSQFPDLDDTPGPIYVAGTFISSGGTTINRVGQWTGSAWTALNSGADTGIAPGATRTVVSGATVPGVYGMVLGGDDSLYAGGQFESGTLNNVTRWNGTSWVVMGSGLKMGSAGRVVQDMVMGNDFIGGDDTNYADDTIYAIGGFEGICANLVCGSASPTAEGIAQYSPLTDTWSRVGSGALSSGDQVFAGAYIDSTLYVGGDFSSIGGVAASLVAKWNGTTWAPLDQGLGSSLTSVYAMAVHPITKDLYVGGTFGQPVGGTAGSTPGIIKWDYLSQAWYPVGTGLATGNVDDIGFSADGTTMWMGMWGGAIGGTNANHVARLSSASLADPAAQAVTGEWDYIKSAGVIGVTGPANGTINQAAVRAVLPQSGGSVMIGGNFHSAGAVSAGRVATFTPGAEPSPYDPVFPPGAPTDVVATSGWNKVTVDWKAPADTGSYPITNYLVTSSPGNRSCITTLADPKLTQCTFTSLTPGTQYTFSVQALNGGGWGNRSTASNVASPQNLKITSYKRKKLNFFQGSGSEVTTSGVAPGFAPGTRIIPWVQVGGGAWESAATSSLTVSSSATFSWKRKFSKKQNSTPISVKFEIGGNFSNTVVIGPVR